MDLTAVASIGVIVSGLTGAVVALLRSRTDRESLAVKTQKDVIADMRDLVDELVEALERCRARRLELEAERDEMQRAHVQETSRHRLERQTLRATQERLEAELQQVRGRLGES